MDAQRRNTHSGLLVGLLGLLIAAAGPEGASAVGAEPECSGRAATVVGSPGPDVLEGTTGSDVIVGEGGDDVVHARSGDDLVCGGPGADSVVGSAGSDTLIGGRGDDVLNGGAGDDRLQAGAGTDTCLQGPGIGTEASCERLDLQPSFPILATFFYPWYPENWTTDGVYPGSNYHPSLGFYRSADPSVIRSQIRAMRYGRIEAGISSWWGQGTPTDRRVPRLLRAATDTTFRWTLYYELEGYGDPAVGTIRDDLRYIRSRYGSNQSFLRINGRFVVFVFSADDTSCGVARRWTRANTVGAYLVMEAFPGFLDCPTQPDGWHLYGGGAEVAALPLHSYTVSPGFWKVGEDPFLERDPGRWLQDVSNMLGSAAPWQLLTTFNEWIEGTSIESASEWASDSGFGTYLDALHDAVPTPPNPLPNLALGKPATASKSVPGSPPSGAVDGVTEFTWNAGDFAPQWIEIDLGSPQTIGRLALLTTQLPEGDTVHRVLGKAAPGDPYQLLHEFAGFSTEGQWLTHAPPTPWTDIRFVRVETTVSPSWVAWREIEIYPPS
jgi:hypothetical protein